MIMLLGVRILRKVIGIPEVVDVVEGGGLCIESA